MVQGVIIAVLVGILGFIIGLTKANIITDGERDNLIQSSFDQGYAQGQKDPDPEILKDAYRQGVVDEINDKAREKMKADPRDFLSSFEEFLKDVPDP